MPFLLERAIPMNVMSNDMKICRAMRKVPSGGPASSVEDLPKKKVRIAVQQKSKTAQAAKKILTTR